MIMNDYSHCVEFDALGVDMDGDINVVSLHILCINEEEAEYVAKVLRRDTVQFSCVTIVEFDESIQEEVDADH
jgi:hypothetical protein